MVLGLPQDVKNHIVSIKVGVNTGVLGDGALTQYLCQADTAGRRPSLITVLRLRGPCTPHSSPLTSNTTSVSESDDRPDLQNTQRN